MVAYDDMTCNNSNIKTIVFYSLIFIVYRLKRVKGYKFILWIRKFRRGVIGLQRLNIEDIIQYTWNTNGYNFTGYDIWCMYVCNNVI